MVAISFLITCLFSGVMLLGQSTQPSAPDLQMQLAAARKQLNVTKKAFHDQLVNYDAYKIAKERYDNAVADMEAARSSSDINERSQAATNKINAETALKAVIKRLETSDSDIAMAMGRVSQITQQLQHIRAAKQQSSHAAATAPSEKRLTFRTLQELINLIPREYVPDEGKKWNNVNRALVEQWMNEHTVGDTVQIPVHLYGLKYIKGRQSKNESHPTKIRAGAVYQLVKISSLSRPDRWIQKGIFCHGYWFEPTLLLEFSGDVAGQLAKIDLYDVTKRPGTRLDIRGRIKKIIVPDTAGIAFVGGEAKYVTGQITIKLENCEVK